MKLLMEQVRGIEANTPRWNTAQREQSFQQRLWMEVAHASAKWMMMVGDQELELPQLRPRGLSHHCCCH